MPVISRKKQHYAISDTLDRYLLDYGRQSIIPIVYQDLCHFGESFPHTDLSGKETLWQTVVYTPHDLRTLQKKLTRVYALLKIGGDIAMSEHLTLERIDWAPFGNSQPFRIRITNRYNDNSDHYYVKRADASRIYGLELEHILSPNRINFLVNEGTVVEEHIAGIPGDVFIGNNFRGYEVGEVNKVRLAKEFVKFNERCFIRLLGDMRSVNYVIDITPDFEEVQYRVRAIDFDQQSYEGRRNMYLAHFFKDNYPVVELVTGLLNPPTIQQYQQEEHTLIYRRVKIAQQRLTALLNCMATEVLSPPEKVELLKAELNEFHETDAFGACQTMGDVVRTNINVMLANIHW